MLRSRSVSNSQHNRHVSIDTTLVRGARPRSALGRLHLAAPAAAVRREEPRRADPTDAQQDVELAAGVAPNPRSIHGVWGVGRPRIGSADAATHADDVAEEEVVGGHE